MNRRSKLPTYYYKDNADGHLTKSVGKHLRDYKIYGNSIQEGTPSLETPVEIMSVGDRTKNLLKYGLPRVGGSYSAQRAHMKKTLVKYEPGEYLLSFDTITDATTYRLGWIACVDEEGAEEITTFNNAYFKVILSITADSTDKGQYVDSAQFWTYNANRAVTLNKISLSVTQTCYISFIIRGGDTTDSSEVVAPQLELGSERTEYVPYHEGYRIPVKVAGKNLFNRDALRAVDVRTKRYGDYGITQVRTAAGNTGTYIPINIKKDTQFNITYKLVDFVQIDAAYIRVYVRFRNSAGTVVLTQSSGNLTSSRIGTVYTFTKTAPEDIAYIEFYTQSTWTEGEGFTIDNIMISAYSDSVFEPYEEPSTTYIILDEPLRGHDGAYDYLSFKNQKVIRNIKVVDDTGTLSIGESLQKLESPTEFSVEIPKVPTIKNSCDIAVSTTVLPSQIGYQYYRGGK